MPALTANLLDLSSWKLQIRQKKKKRPSNIWKYENATGQPEFKLFGKNSVCLWVGMLQSIGTLWLVTGWGSQKGRSEWPIRLHNVLCSTFSLSFSVFLFLLKAQVLPFWQSLAFWDTQIGGFAKVVSDFNSTLGCIHAEFGTTTKFELSTFV